MSPRIFHRLIKIGPCKSGHRSSHSPASQSFRPEHCQLRPRAAAALAIAHHPPTRKHAARLAGVPAPPSPLPRPPPPGHPPLPRKTVPPFISSSRSCRWA
ncbi:hypothetical protein GQ55_4G269000 [Panicum hallii var. hallii]|uniref:Uncharacterized protein n=1 Tax=Panicum hallii var. hallii TaxID=1504633 RepID=A0A2T7E0L9_9POAL|nr:hypothetical protein GQ55_4G269000 [Panicum hallii var. hallii]